MQTDLAGDRTQTAPRLSFLVRFFDLGFFPGSDRYADEKINGLVPYLAGSTVFSRVNESLVIAYAKIHPRSLHQLVTDSGLEKEMLLKSELEK